MSKAAKRERIPEEFGDAKELLTAAVLIPQPLPQLEISPYIPDTHTAQHNYEIFKSLVLTYEVHPPAGEQYIDIKDKFKLIVRVSNTYEYTTGPQLYKLVPSVWFKDVWLYVVGTKYATIVNPNPWNMYVLVSGTNRLKPGNSVVKEFTLEAKDQITGPYDPKERVADIRLYAKLDLEQFFKYSKFISAYTQIRPP